MEVDKDDFLELGVQENDLIDDIEMSDDELNAELEMLNKQENVKWEIKAEIKTEEGEYAENENEFKTEIKTEFAECVKHESAECVKHESDQQDDKYATNKERIKVRPSSPSTKTINNNNRPKKRNRDDYGDIQLDKKRLYKPLYVDKNTDPVVVGREISYRLQEKKSNLIKNVVRVIGISMSVEVFQETKKIVKSGGLKTDDGQRKRSPGGTYLYILKNRGYASTAQMKEIFKVEHERHKEKRKYKAQKLKNRERKSIKVEKQDEKPKAKVEE